MRALFIRALAALSVVFLAVPNNAWALGNEVCDLPQAQSVERWPFNIILEERPAIWSSEKTAKDLYRMQGQYFTSKSSPFLRSSIPSTLSFYEPGVSMTVSPRIVYSRTVDGRKCAMVVGATVNVVHSGNIMLAKELVERSCVARAAMAHQLKHHEVTLTVLRELAEAKDKIKYDVFEVYKAQGAAGATEREVGDSLVNFQKKAVAKVFGIFTPYLRQSRRENAETPALVGALTQSCKGQFEESSKLAR